MIRRMRPLLSALLLVPAAGIAQTSSPPNGPQLAIAHRGASAYAPEHTFFAYDLAMAMDVDMLECDLFLSKDEVPVCIHDTTVDRTSDGTGEVSSFTLAQLRELDFGSWFSSNEHWKAEYAGAKIVPFEEQLDCYLRHNPRMRFHVETKDSAGGRAEEVMVDVLTRKGLIATGDLELENGNIQSSTILVQSFDATSLERMKQLAPTIPTAFLYPGGTAGTSAAIAGQAQSTGDGPDYIDGYAPNSAALTSDPTAVQKFHLAGHDVHTWTVNDEATMGELLDMGVDGIFTNNPDRLRAQIDSRGTGTTPEERANPADFARGCPGIAGRVTSNEGPGDVWEPTGTRGVQLKTQAAEVPPPFGTSSGIVLGGALGIGALLLLAVASGLRRRG